MDSAPAAAATRNRQSRLDDMATVRTIIAVPKLILAAIVALIMFSTVKVPRHTRLQSLINVNDDSSFNVTWSLEHHFCRVPAALAVEQPSNASVLRALGLPDGTTLNSAWLWRVGVCRAKARLVGSALAPQQQHLCFCHVPWHVTAVGALAAFMALCAAVHIATDMCCAVSVDDNIRGSSFGLHCFNPAAFALWTIAVFVFLLNEIHTTHTVTLPDKYSLTLPPTVRYLKLVEQHWVGIMMALIYWFVCVVEMCLMVDIDYDDDGHPVYCRTCVIIKSKHKPVFTVYNEESGLAAAPSQSNPQQQQQQLLYGDSPRPVTSGRVDQNRATSPEKMSPDREFVSERSKVTFFEPTPPPANEYLYQPPQGSRVPDGRWLAQHPHGRDNLRGTEQYLELRDLFGQLKVDKRRLQQPQRKFSPAGQQQQQQMCQKRTKPLKRLTSKSL